MSSFVSKPFGELPADWTYSTIGKNVDFATGPAFDSSNFNDLGIGYKLVRGINLTRGVTRWDSGNTKYWNDSTNEYKKYELQVGDVVVGMDGSLVGKNYAQISNKDLPALLVQRVARLRCKEFLDQRFLYYAFASDSWISYVEIVKTNSGIPHISNGDIKDFSIPFPIESEQQKIASILTSVDEVIASTAAQINKLKDLKTGMMQELLTKGIGHTEFKDSELGRIPKEWSASVLLNCVKIKNNLRKPINKEERECVKGVYPYYGPTKAVDYLNEYRVEGDHVLIGEDGDHFIKFSSWSMTQFVTGKFNVNNHAHILQGTELCLTKWIYYFFMHRDITPALTRQGATRYKLNKASLESLDIVLPPISEQGAIVKIFDSLLESMKASETKLLKLSSIKKSLMQDLLTGKVRVEVNQ